MSFENYVPTSVGFKKVSDLVENDVFYSNNAYRVVDHVTPYLGSDKIYEIRTRFETVITRHILNQPPGYIYYRKIDCIKFDDVENFNIFKYAPIKYNNYLYDVSLNGDKLAKEIKLPSWYISKALTIGIPEHEEYETTLNNYAFSQGFKTLNEFKQHIVLSNSHKVSSNIKMDKGFLTLAFLFLIQRVDVKGDGQVDIILEDDTTYSDAIIKFLLKNKFAFETVRYKTKDYTILRVQSKLLVNMLKDDFNHFKFLFNLTESLSTFFIKLFKDFGSLYISNNLKESVPNLVQYFYYNDMLAAFETESYGKQIIYFLEDHEYFVEDDHYYFEVLEKKLSNDCLYSIRMK